MILSFLVETRIGRFILKRIYNLVIKLVGKKTALSTSVDGIIEGYVSNVVCFENDILKKGNSIVSALSSVGGLIALFLDLSDDKWDDCLVINY